MQAFTKILIVDDSYTARVFIRTCFQMIGNDACEILECRNGKEALSLLRENRNVELVITDLNMPVMDGYEFIQRIRASPLLADVNILVVSSAGNTEKASELQALGAAATLQKPITPARLLLALEEIWRTKESE